MQTNCVRKTGAVFLESNTYHRPKPDRQPMTYYTTHNSVLCMANIIGLNQMSYAA